VSLGLPPEYSQAIPYLLSIGYETGFLTENRSKSIGSFRQHADGELAGRPIRLFLPAALTLARRGSPDSTSGLLPQSQVSKMDLEQYDTENLHSKVLPMEHKHLIL
jgi:hypothetical protein